MINNIRLTMQVKKLLKDNKIVNDKFENDAPVALAFT